MRLLGRNDFMCDKTSEEQAVGSRLPLASVCVCVRKRERESASGSIVFPRWTPLSLVPAYRRCYRYPETHEEL